METTNVSYRQLDDDKLISLGLKGDQEALHILFMRYRRLLYSLAHRILRNHEEAEDAVQNCLLQAFRNLESVKSRGAFRNWLVRILINEALVIIRKKKSRPTLAPDQHSSEEQGATLDRFPAAGRDPEQELARQESVAALVAHLAHLPTPLRSAILLCDISEHSIREASAVLGLAPNTVKARLHRGRMKLGVAMKPGVPRWNLPDAVREPGGTGQSLSTADRLRA